MDIGFRSHNHQKQQLCFRPALAARPEVAGALRRLWWSKQAHQPTNQTKFRHTASRLNNQFMGIEKRKIYFGNSAFI